MKNNFILLLAFVFILFNCKKKETTSQEPSPTQGNTGSSIVPTSFDGFFQSTGYAVWTGSTSTIGSFYNVNVYIMSSPSATINSFLGINSGTVNLNSTKLKYASGRYYDTTYALNLTSQKNFQLQSNGSIPSFTYNNIDSFPNFYFNYNNLINDTLTKASNYTIPLNGFSYSDEVKVSLQDPNNFTNFVSRIVSKGTTQIILNPSELSVFSTGSNITLSVELKKYNYQNINGKSFRFESNTYSSFSVHVIQ
ncbi:MAG: hypothetical protein WCH21_03360 [Bacteroidota bacterium]